MTASALADRNEAHRGAEPDTGPCVVTAARAGWQPATTGMVDAGDFAGF